MVDPAGVPLDPKPSGVSLAVTTRPRQRHSFYVGGDATVRNFMNTTKMQGVTRPNYHRPSTISHDRCNDVISLSQLYFTNRNETQFTKQAGC
ncbi:hypothetical protein HOLleu_15651 [Holothuria leucospilota]|uniref:Uncharacterized protein n=1 Tax=Holothuria leucospilota TaxID=206669 RepID=A0A9Q1C505_HOLLE|nr:hypothetical protein HOLleu_15651 [Holothuria leucospilota]